MFVKYVYAFRDANFIIESILTECVTNEICQTKLPLKHGFNFLECFENMGNDFADWKV